MVHIFKRRAFTYFSGCCPFLFTMLINNQLFPPTQLSLYHNRQTVVLDRILDCSLIYCSDPVITLIVAQPPSMIKNTFQYLSPNLQVWCLVALLRLRAAQFRILLCSCSSSGIQLNGGLPIFASLYNKFRDSLGSFFVLT